MSPRETKLREELESRREQLDALVSNRPEENLVDLLRRVDAALERVGRTEWGQPAMGHERVEADRLARDPLIQVCLDCLSPEGQRALEDDLEGAARVQRTLLPPADMALGEWRHSWLWEPLGVVSGDHLDVIAPRTEEEPVQILFGDVAGKGIAASMLQSHLHALARALLCLDCPLGEIMEQINHHFCSATGSASYATLLAVRLYPGGRLELVNAGHPRPLVGDARGVRPIEGAGLPVGLFCDAQYPTRELSLAEGDVLLLYTDGWTEAAREGEEFGIGRASAALRRSKNGSPHDLVQACRDEMERFLDGNPRPDDLTLLALRRDTFSASQ